ncbi:hypothetical protein PPL_10398 [Heterostelium album PN500]|uniref:Uncharacterized protein n=1 Tax=Heterostelium pallidum (strain ATCC 26659 / Pp 5 / PN500) TaxID=670386 RepID=D3BQZ5_HETP5|nr:hypothetical protein PPL_10398 [Heterostelium album PN500]EFA76181.1 hypothetical protein PPL_10398 [Heterostelium album PN500]|eukprot:XP_020428314.1 hypothetical protein PPL_10398 [Heterostelium album PN500]
MFGPSVAHLRKFATSASIRRQRLVQKEAEERRKASRPNRPISKFLKEIFQYSEESATNVSTKN